MFSSPSHHGAMLNTLLHPPSSLGLGGLVDLEELNTCPVQLTDTSSLLPPRGRCLINAQS